MVRINDLSPLVYHDRGIISRSVVLRGQPRYNRTPESLCDIAGPRSGGRFVERLDKGGDCFGGGEIVAGEGEFGENDEVELRAGKEGEELRCARRVFLWLAEEGRRLDNGHAHAMQEPSGAGNGDGNDSGRATRRLVAGRPSVVAKPWGSITESP